MRFSKERWLQEGLRALDQEGPSGLRVERLCARLHVTKGSFYHHFADLKDFQSSLLQHWEQQSTREVLKRTQSAPSPRDKLLALRALSSTIPRNPDVAIRTWARHDLLARRFQTRVDRLRCAALESLYAQLVSPKEAKLYARLVCCLFVGAQQLTPPVRPGELDEMYGLIIRRKKDSDGHP